MPQSTAPWTVARWRELAPREGEKFEVIEGGLVVSGVPERRHAVAVAEVAAPVAEHVRHHNLGEIHHYWAPVFLNEHNVHLPDFVVFPPPTSRNADWEDLGTPLLAVEVLSPATAKHDRGAKRQRYQASGVAEYWIVDLDARLVERWRPGDQRPEISRDALTWQPVSAREPTMDLRQCFRSVLGA